MQEVTLKLNSLKLIVLELLRAFKSIKEENKSLKKTVVFLEEKVKKLERVNNLEKTTSDLKIKVGETINDIEDVIRLLS